MVDVFTIRFLLPVSLTTVLLLHQIVLASFTERRAKKAERDDTSILSSTLINLLSKLHVDRIAFRSRLVNRQNHGKIELKPASGKGHGLSVLYQFNKRE